MIDAHCHIDLYPDPLAEAKRIERAGDIAVAVTNLPSHYELGRPYLRGFRRVRLALGLHPLLAHQHEAELPAFERLAVEANYIGEIGLDFSPAGFRTRDIQMESFARVLGAIRDRRRFITLHSRRAEQQTLQLLTNHEVEGAVFHWFTGSLKLVREIASAGHFFSVNNAMVASDRGLRLVAAMPKDRVLTETDGPHITRRTERIAPADTRDVLAALSRTWAITPAEVTRVVKDNFERALPPKLLRA